MSGYKFNRVPVQQEEAANAVIEAGSATTTYNITFDNGSATVPSEVPVKLDFGASS